MSNDSLPDLLQNKQPDDPLDLLTAYHLNSPKALYNKMFDAHWTVKKELAQVPPMRLETARQNALASLQRCDELGIGMMSIRDAAYPKRLLNINDPAPAVFFWRGDFSSLARHRTVAIVGARKATPRARVITNEIVEALAPLNITLVSGMALGVDAWAHAAALQFNVPTVACLAHGLDSISPETNLALAQSILDEGGCWVSQYPPDVPASKHTFPLRNRIIAGLSQAVIVVESAFIGGSLITANKGIDYNREVFVVSPGWKNKRAAGNERLMMEFGVASFNSPKALLGLLGWDAPTAPSTSFRLPADAPLVEALSPTDPLDFDAILSKLACGAAELRVRLMHAEMDRWAIRWPGDRYTSCSE
jgi:DNA processing protein